MIKAFLKAKILFREGEKKEGVIKLSALTRTSGRAQAWVRSSVRVTR